MLKAPCVSNNCHLFLFMWFNISLPLSIAPPRDKNQLIIFCRTLYNILPYDASVKAVDSGSNARVEARSHLIAHLQSELDMIKETMTSDSQLEASKPAHSVSKGLRLKDFVNLREDTDGAMRKFSSISGT